MIDLSSIDTPSAKLLTKEAIDRYLVLRVTEGLPENGDTYRHLKKHIKERFGSVYGETPISLIRPDHLRSWAAGLVNPRSGQPFDKLTVRHHLIDVKTFFRRVHGEGWIERDPSRVVVLPPVEDKDVNIIDVLDAFQFFKANREARAVGRIALEAFGGLRYTTAGKIVLDDIKFTRRGIEMPSAKHKSRKRKFRQGQPSNLWAWLEHAPKTCWDLTFRQYRDEKKEMHVRAGLREMVMKSELDRQRVKALKNVWRHSFATYLLAQLKVFGPVSYLMQHSRASTTEVYEGRGDEREAAMYFAITPQTVLLTWEEFQRLFPITAPSAPTQ